MIRSPERREENMKRHSLKKSSRQHSKKAYSRKNLISVVFQPLSTSVSSCTDSGNNFLFFQPHNVVERRRTILAIEKALEESDQPYRPIFCMNLPEGIYRPVFSVETNPYEGNSKSVQNISTSSQPEISDNTVVSYPTLSDNRIETSQFHSASKNSLKWFCTENSILNDEETVLVPLNHSKGLVDKKQVEYEDKTKAKCGEGEIKDYFRHRSGGVSWIRLKKDLHSVFNGLHPISTTLAAPCIELMPLYWRKDQICNIAITPIFGSGFKLTGT